MTMTPTALKKDETKQTESQAHIIQKPLFIVERFPVLYCFNISHAQNRQCSSCRSCSDNMKFRNGSSFVETYYISWYFIGFSITYILCKI